jgi:hypothetical protein
MWRTRRLPARRCRPSDTGPQHHSLPAPGRRGYQDGALSLAGPPEQCTAEHHSPHVGQCGRNGGDFCGGTLGERDTSISPAWLPAIRRLGFSELSANPWPALVPAGNMRLILGNDAHDPGGGATASAATRPSSAPGRQQQAVSAQSGMGALALWLPSTLPVSRVGRGKAPRRALNRGAGTR